MRVYDTRLGRFLSIDPLYTKYPYYSTFQFTGNSPIQFIDLDGAEGAKPKTDNFEQSAKDGYLAGGNASENPVVLTELKNQLSIGALKPLSFGDKVNRFTIGLYGNTYGEYSGNDNGGNDRVYNPDGLQFSLGGNVLNYSGSLNITYLKNVGIGTNLTGSTEYTGTSLISFSPSFGEIYFTTNVPLAKRNFLVLSGEGYNTTTSAGPLNFQIGGSNDQKGNVNYSIVSFGLGLPAKLNKTPLPFVGFSKEKNYTTQSLIFQF